MTEQYWTQPPGWKEPDPPNSTDEPYGWETWDGFIESVRARAAQEPGADELLRYKRGGDKAIQMLAAKMSLFTNRVAEEVAAPGQKTALSNAIRKEILAEITGDRSVLSTSNHLTANWRFLESVMGPGYRLDVSVERLLEERYG